MTRKARMCTVMCAAVVGAALALPTGAVAQEEEGPGQRVMTVTSFDVPFNDRNVVLPFMMERIVPGTQLNPKVINFRVSFHNWGANADQVLMIAEYADFADIESDCGQPCDDYYDANPAPEEGEQGYEDFQKAQRLFNKYYAHHSDEIYVSPMGVAKVEGEMMGPVGGPEEEEGGM